MWVPTTSWRFINLSKVSSVREEIFSNAVLVLRLPVQRNMRCLIFFLTLSLQTDSSSFVWVHFYSQPGSIDGYCNYLYATVFSVLFHNQFYFAAGLVLQDQQNDIKEATRIPESRDSNVKVKTLNVIPHPLFNRHLT